MICRDPSFWDSVAQHEAVAPFVFMGEEPRSLGFLVSDERNLPLRSDNGGVILLSMDALGFYREMHTLYTPDGWGREVATAGRGFMREAFKTCHVLFTNEQEGEYRTAPPKSHGWKPCGDFTNVGLLRRLRPWMLTKEAWLASPVGRKTECL